MNTFWVWRADEDRPTEGEWKELLASELSDAELLALPAAEQAAALGELDAMIEDGRVVDAPAVYVRRACSACGGFGCSGCDHRGSRARRYRLAELHLLDDGALLDAITRETGVELEALLAERARRRAAERTAA